MSKHTSVACRAIAALTKPAQASAQHALIALSIFGVISGTTYHVLSTDAQSDPVQSCMSGCASMTCSSGTSAEQCAQYKTTCESGCANMGTSQSSSIQGGSSGGSGTCDTQPAWPDCASFSCTSGNWTCTSMKSTTSSSSSSIQGGSSGGSGTCGTQPNWPDCAEFSCTAGNWTCRIMKSSSSSFGGGMNVEQCLNGCNTMTGTAEQQTMCKNGCNSMGQSGGYQGGGSISMQPCAAGQMPTAANPCLFNPMGGTSGGTGNTGRMCDFYRSGPPPSCAYSSPACAVYTEPPTALSCDDPQCTSSWNRNCFSPGSRPNSEGSGGQSGGNDQSGYNQSGYNQGDYMRNAPGYYNGGYYPGMMNPGMQGGNSEEMQAQQEAMMKEQQVRMLEQMKNEGERQCQHFLDPLKSAFNMPKTMQDAIKSYHKKCIAGVQTAASPEEFYGLMESLRTEMTGLFEKTSSCDGVESFIRGMEQGATKEAPRFIKQTEKKNPALAKQMEEMRQQTITAVKTATQQVTGGDCKAAQLTMETMEQAFESASRSWGKGGFSMLDDDVMANHFTKKMQQHGVNVSAGDLQKYGIASTEHMDIMSGLMVYGGDSMDRFFQDDNGATIIKTLAAGGASSEQTSLMAQILEENKRLREEVGELRAQLNKTQAALADRLSSLTADTRIASQIQDFVAHELADIELTPKEADNIYETFMIENGKELVKKGLVTNIDLNLGDWFTPSVITANREGFMKGDPTGYFRPAAEMNQAEAAVTMARAFGVEVIEGDESSDQRFANYPEWSRASIKALEENGIDLSVLSPQADQAISRSQVSVLLSRLLPDEASEGKFAKVFTDIGGVDQKTAAAIQELSALGIANGVNNGTKYNPSGTVDRATFATYLTRSVDAAEEFLGVNDAAGKEALNTSSGQEDSEESVQ